MALAPPDPVPSQLPEGRQVWPKTGGDDHLVYPDLPFTPIVQPGDQESAAVRLDMADQKGRERLHGAIPNAGPAKAPQHATLQQAIVGAAAEPHGSERLAEHPRDPGMRGTLGQAHKAQHDTHRRVPAADHQYGPAGVGLALCSQHVCHAVGDEAGMCCLTKSRQTARPRRMGEPQLPEQSITAAASTSPFDAATCNTNGVAFLPASRIRS